jgi:GNAT superfamily N-acetyltransferase
MYYISDKKENLQIDKVKRLLLQTYWANMRSHETIEKSVANSLCFGAYLDKNDSQIAFARVITDYATNYYLCDVVVDEEYRGLGVGKALVEKITSDARLVRLRGILATEDAHGLYEKYGFYKDENRFMMSRHKVDDSGCDS